MQLSQAIRIGCRFRPQTFDAYVNSRGSDALFAGYEGLNGKMMPTDIDVFQRASLSAFPVLQVLISACPYREDCQKFKQRMIEKGYVNVCGTTAHLADDHWMTREQIADWVEQVEIEAKAKSLI